KGYSETTYDGLSRVLTVKTYDKAVPNPTLTGTVSTAYDGRYTTVTDQANKVRRSKVDGLGRLIRVDEPTGSGLGASLESPNQATTYTYDVLDNLIKVEQPQASPAVMQTRRFAYDALSRLIFAANPEQATHSQLSYDNQNW